jgi:predicted nuclease of predicted toxin-antitoxin system
MNLLLDTCVWSGAKAVVENAGHNAIWIGNMEKDPGDKAIILKAYIENRILITLDKDFGELAIMHNFSHAGIIRLVDCAAQKQGQLCVFILQQYAEVLMQGAIITAEPGRVRIRPGTIT